MMYAVLSVDEKSAGKPAVITTYLDDKVFREKQFPSEAAAKAALAHAGYVSIGDPERYYPIVLTDTFTAVSRRGLGFSMQEVVSSPPDLYVLVVEAAACGYGFTFSFDSVAARDPIIETLTTGLFQVQAIGTWSTEFAALEAGRAFFLAVQEMVGGPTMMMALLNIVKEKWRWQTRNKSKKMWRAQMATQIATT